MTNVNMEHKKKYPRTYHLPWSQTVASDDKRLLSTDCFSGKEVQISIKKDGESTAMYSDYLHARSLDSKHNFTRDWAKKLHSILKYDIPEGWIFSFVAGLEIRLSNSDEVEVHNHSNLLL